MNPRPDQPSVLARLRATSMPMSGRTNQRWHLEMGVGGGNHLLQACS
uniref:Uncharacterized protein n=1 Tax=Arundo donax TaxID=35708 RepID=A0A0A9AN41_ARUDO